MRIIYVSIKKFGTYKDALAYFSEMIRFLKSKQCKVFLISNRGKMKIKEYWIARALEDHETIQSTGIRLLERLQYKYEIHELS